MKDFLSLCRSRCSIRSFRPTPVPQEKITYIMECVRMAPSAVNFQPWWFHVVYEKDELARLSTCYDREWFAKIPMCIVACRKPAEEWVRKTDGKAHGDIDVAIAVEHLCLAAAEQELGTCWVCNFDAEKCKTACELPNGYEPVALIPVGYPSPNLSTEKKRKDLADICDL